MFLNKLLGSSDQVLHRPSNTIVGDLPSELAPPARFIPAGFDAILQFDDRLLNYQLLENLRNEGLTTLSAEVPYDGALVPKSLSIVIKDQISFMDLNVFNRIFVEMRFIRPRLSTIRSNNQYVELGWSIELNLLKRTSREVAVEISGRRSVTNDAGESFIEERIALAMGKAITASRANLVFRPNSLHLWIALDFSDSIPQTETDDSVMDDFLKSQLSNVLISTLMLPLVNTPDIRFTPQIALAGKFSPARIARVGLSDLRVREVILLHPDGREVLSLCINTGETGGSERLIQPFLGAHNFAYFVSLNVFVPVLRERWNAQSLLRSFVGDIPVELASSEDSDDTQEGRARVMVTISANVSEISVRAAEDELGDPVRIRSEMEIRLLKLWDHHGDEITNLGELAKSTTQPLILHALLFEREDDAADTSEEQEAFREFIANVFSPAILPFVEAYKVSSFSGYTSSALGAIVTRLSLQELSIGPVEIADTANLATNP